MAGYEAYKLYTLRSIGSLIFLLQYLRARIRERDTTVTTFLAGMCRCHLATHSFRRHWHHSLCIPLRISALYVFVCNFLPPRPFSPHCLRLWTRAKSRICPIIPSMLREGSANAEHDVSV